MFGASGRIGLQRKKEYALLKTTLLIAAAMIAAPMIADAQTTDQRGPVGRDSLTYRDGSSPNLDRSKGGRVQANSMNLNGRTTTPNAVNNSGYQTIRNRATGEIMGTRSLATGITTWK